MIADLNKSRSKTDAKPRVYVAGDLIAEAMRHQIEQMAKEFEKDGFEVFLPHRDAGILKEADIRGIEARKKAFGSIFERDIAEIEKADYFVCVLDGLCFGTSLELGYAYALKRLLKRDLTIAGVYTDLRGMDSLDLMRTYACDVICTSVRDISKMVRELSAR